MRPYPKEAKARDPCLEKGAKVQAYTTDHMAACWKFYFFECTQVVLLLSCKHSINRGHCVPGSSAPARTKGWGQFRAIIGNQSRHPRGLFFLAWHTKPWFSCLVNKPTKGSVHSSCCSISRGVPFRTSGLKDLLGFVLLRLYHISKMTGACPTPQCY